MKKLWFVFLICCAMTGCGDKAEGRPSYASSWATRPYLLYEEEVYVDPYMPVRALPDGYAYAGTVSEEMANDTCPDCVGLKFYTKDGAKDFYTYQECGTPVSSDTVDTTKRQWAYIRWVPEEERPGG